VGALLEHHYAGVPWPPLLRAVVLESDERRIAMDISFGRSGKCWLGPGVCRCDLVWDWFNLSTLWLAGCLGLAILQFRWRCAACIPFSLTGSR
jgi:hypothetical protein